MGFSNWLRRKGKPDKDKALPVGMESALESRQDSQEASQNGNMESRQQQPEQSRGFFSRLKDGLERTRSAFVARVDTCNFTRAATFFANPSTSFTQERYYALSTCSKFSSTGVSRPNTETITRSLPLSRLTSSIVPVKFTKGPSITCTLSPTE